MPARAQDSDDEHHTMTVTRSMIAQTDAVIRPYIRRTPVITFDGRDIGARNADVSIKLELMQRSGSFKVRGAFANLLMRDVPDVGVVAASGGNHGAAVAYAAHKLGIPAKIFVPRISSPAKVARIHSYGAELVVGGDGYSDALAASEDWAAETGALRVHAFDQTETVCGQGTIALELEQQVPSLDTVLLAVGGGGLLGGAASWFENRVKVVGVEPESAPTLTRALEAGEPVDAPAGGIAADSLAPRRIGSLVFPIAQKLVRDVILVTDKAIRDAQEMLWKELRIVAEPGGAAAFSAVMSGAYPSTESERIAIVVSGGNTVAVNFGA
jgi:threonine dehydratase